MIDNLVDWIFVLLVSGGAFYGFVKVMDVLVSAFDLLIEKPAPPKRDAYGFIVQESKVPKYHYAPKDQQSR